VQTRHLEWMPMRLAELLSAPGKAFRPIEHIFQQLNYKQASNYYLSDYFTRQFMLFFLSFLIYDSFVD
jgi:hypothetical protein